MLDLNVLLKKQSEGVRLFATLEPKETVILQNFSLLVAQELTKAGRQQNQSTNNIILNAFHNGICLGLGLDVRQDQVLERSKS
jgi:hypothetical protein